MKISYHYLVFFVLLLINCHKNIPKPITPEIIPIPVSQTITEGTFILNNAVSVNYQDEFKSVANYFSEYIEKQYDITLTTAKTGAKIQFLKDDTLKNEEAYILTITPKEIIISASSAKGAFYGVQSLLQLMPVATNSKSMAIQCLEIKDSPRFVYRGMHLDVARHFFSVDFIKKYIDMLAMLKMNTFHWHLTEDQGWRIEIKKYPKLQEVAAYRKETLIGHYSDQPHQFDGKRYGGYYTQEEIREVVTYAAERQVTIIPEIEMPGHSQAAIAAYPELGCTGDTIEVATKWGVFEDIYCPKETTFQFLEDVIDEVVSLFPGKYIHIGGDEAPKKRWRNCAHCQQLIKEKGLKDEHELQSYFITRMEQYINSKGKQLIGWDEILEGGLAPNATVMSWRGTKGAVEAAKAHHNVVLTPNSHCYFDHYQSTHENEPLAIGGFLPLEKVYHFNPIPKELTKEEAQYVLGAQGNVWTEYMKTPEKVEYMIFPRVAALSEVVWSSSKQKNYDDFKKRLLSFFKRLDHLSINHANHLYELRGKPLYAKDSTFYILEAQISGKDIRFTLDGTIPTEKSTLYTAPIPITKSVTIKAASFDKKEQIGAVFSKDILKHKAINQTISLSVPPNPTYGKGGKEILINGIQGNKSRYGDKEWLGFDTDSVSITIDFEKPTAISSIITRFYNSVGSWIYPPKKYTVSLNNGFTKEVVLNTTSETTVKSRISIPKQTVKQLNITISCFGKIPEGEQGAGHLAWLFIDEIIVD
ncbi:family 20 glycosylhydrolase [Tenacibaculum tangerinum]|uniref:beta-N-acetylhexosaminidase n=1 Tax=Tenacibaculum tangerinum TaxID=3038772 RepID=A0ABY8L5H0_9FLAO|nr:family 20 glycosylhydrolase [Tenacibaculum tangerinum]WGH76321.1 family 20 glycosylhydrolase [Tenacibaculum tangerinum]